MDFVPIHPEKNFYPINFANREKVLSWNPTACLISTSRSKGLLIFRDLKYSELLRSFPTHGPNPPDGMGKSLP
jgi:hypothetical protein